MRESLDAGVAGCLSKMLPADDLIDALARVVAGEVVVSPDPGVEALPSAGDWPGRSVGLTAREAEVLALIAQGLTNHEITERAYITMNSVKSHIRSLYRKINVQRRSQAVVWAARHDFLPAVQRVVLDRRSHP